MVWVVVGMLVTIEVGDSCGSSGSRDGDGGCMISSVQVHEKSITNFST